MNCKKMGKAILILATIVILAGVGSAYVFVGTYLFPIAPYWVTQLPPNPPSPKTKHDEFAFRLEYEINGVRKVIEDALICDFDGFEVNSIGGPKKRKWKDHYKNEQNNEIFTFRNEPSRNAKIVLENIDKYKVVLSAGFAAYFLGEPEYKGIPELPSIQVYDTITEYYLYPNQCEEFLNEQNFQVISWHCDPPLQNNFK